MYISTHQALLDFCQRAREFDAIAVDTEFLRERTFHPRLCLVQIATPAESVAVDPLVIDDLSPLAELMADESVTKVFHACSQDMEVMLHTVGVLPRPIFDTQVAAAFLGERQQISYGALVQTFCGVSLPKTESLTDWSRRPLTDKQIEYAIDDVKYLIVAYTEMMSRLRELGRVDWVLDELRPLADESHYRHRRPAVAQLPLSALGSRARYVCSSGALDLLPSGRGRCARVVCRCDEWQHHARPSRTWPR